MCAKKATSPAPRKSAAPAAKSAVANKSAANGNASAPAAKSATAAERMLTPHDIGIVAGEIWGLLSKGDSVTIAALKKAINAPGDVVIAAVGWLAREQKLEFKSSGRTLRMSLKS